MNMVTIESITRLSARTWRLAYSSDQGDPVYTIRVGGEIAATTRLGEYVLTLVDGSERPLVEITDGSEAGTERAWPTRMTLAWYASLATDHYRVEQFIGAAWTLIDTVRALGEQTYFEYRTAPLADVTTHQFRIIPVGTNGNQGTAREYSALMVRHPDPPAVNFALDESDNTVDITAA